MIGRRCPVRRPIFLEVPMDRERQDHRHPEGDRVEREDARRMEREEQEETTEEGADRDAGVHAHRDEAVGPGDLLIGLDEVRDRRSRCGEERQLRDRRSEGEDDQGRGSVHEHHRQEEPGRDRLGPDHHLPAIEAVPQRTREGAKQSGNPEGEEQGRCLHAGRMRTVPDRVVEGRVRGGAAGDRDQSTDCETTDPGTCGPLAGAHGAAPREMVPER